MKMTLLFLLTPLLLLSMVAGVLSVVLPSAGMGVLMVMGGLLIVLPAQHKDRALVVLLCLLISGFGYLATDWRINRIQSVLFSDQSNRIFSVVLLEKPVVREKKGKALAKIETGHKVFLYLKGDVSHWVPGQRLKVRGRFSLPESRTNPGQFDLPHYYLIRGVSGSVFVREVLSVLPPRGFWIRRVSSCLKSRIVALHQRTLPYPFSALYTGLIFGDKGVFLPKELKNRFQKLGLTHLLVVSGSQVSLLSGIVYQFLRMMSFRGMALFGIVGGINVFFYFLTGGGASIFRAIVMFMLALGLQLIHRKTTPLHKMSLTALGMLFYNPLYLFDMGFLLSFCATFSLIYGVPWVESWMPPTWPMLIRRSLGITVAPFLFTTPLLWSFFNQVSVVSLLSNLLVVNAIEFLVVLGFFSTVVGLVVWPVSLVLDQVAWAVMMLLEWMAHFLSWVPYGFFFVKRPSIGVFLALYGVIVWGLLASGFSKKWRVGGYGVLGGVIVLGLLVPMLKPRPLKVVFLDVGQGDSTFIQTPKGKTILIDAGDRKRDFRTGRVVFDAAERVVLPALRSWGINKLDLIITTHFDRDHVGGVPMLLSELPVGSVMDNGRSSAAFPPYLQGISRHRIPHYQAISGESLVLEEGIVLKVLHPDPRTGFFEDKNNNSVVVKLSYGEIDFLLLGDLESEGEDRLVARYANELEAEILKVGHHGSKSSSTEPLLSKVRPQVGIISCGRKNKFGHPHKQVVERLSGLGISIYRTDRHGAVTVITDGRRFRCDTFL